MNKKLTAQTMGIIAGIFSAICVTGYLTVNKYVYDHFTISALEYSLFFTFIGGIFGLLSLIGRKTSETLREIKLNFRPLLVLGIAGFLSFGTFVFGQHYTTGMNASLLMTSTIVVTSIFSYVLLKDRLTQWQWLWAGVLFIGLYIGIVGFHSIELKSGDLIILSSVLVFGFGNAFTRVVMKRMDHPSIVPDTRLLIGGILALSVGAFIVHDYHIFLVTFPFALLGGLLYWLCLKSFAKAAYLLDATEAIILTNSQIFFTSITGVFILAEPYNIEKLIGSLIVIMSIYFITKQSRKKDIVNT